MKVFKRELIHTHCVGKEWPDFVGKVELEESFIIETERFWLANGPVEIEGINAGDPIAVHIEDIEILPPFEAPNGGPFIDGELVPLEYSDGYFYYPNHFKLEAKPSVGNVAVLPEPTDEIMEMSREYKYEGKRWKNEHGWRRVVNDPRDKHCHQDCPWLTAGSVIHLKAQVDGAGLCLADVHGYIGQGELAFAGIEVNANVQLEVERSQGWLVDWPIIETSDEIMVFSSYSSAYLSKPRMEYVDVVRQAYTALTEVVAAKIGSTIEEANTIVATAADLRNCALYGLGNYLKQIRESETSEIAVVATLPKEVFNI